MKEINLKIPFSIVENKHLNHIEKLIFSLSYNYHSKLGYNELSNLEISKLFSLSENTVGKYRRSLVEKGYEKKRQSTYFITKKYKEFKSTSKGAIIIPPEVYKLKMNAGAKLLWGLYNSLSNGGKKESFASREYLAEKLNCSKESITNYLMELVKNNTLSDYSILSGKGTKQRRVKTVNFSTKSTVPVAYDRRKEIWKEFIGYKADLKKELQSERSVYEFVKEVYLEIKDHQDKREIISSILYDVDSRLKGTDILESLRDLLKKELKELLYQV